jgi:hypothetical protein
MATNPRSPTQKPKGWRNIVVDDVAYWWKEPHYGGAPYIKRVSDKKTINTWDHLVHVKGWYTGLDRGDISFTPKVIADIIRELPWGEPIKRKTK